MSKPLAFFLAREEETDEAAGKPERSTRCGCRQRSEDTGSDQGAPLDDISRLRPALRHLVAAAWRRSSS